jgi:hypothetical protein
MLTKYARVLRFEVRLFGKEVHTDSSPGKSGNNPPPRWGGKKKKKKET